MRSAALVLAILWSIIRFFPWSLDAYNKALSPLWLVLPMYVAIFFMLNAPDNARWADYLGLAIGVGMVADVLTGWYRLRKQKASTTT